MATITFKGTPIHTAGNLPAAGSRAPDFTLAGADLKDVTLGDLGRKVKILNIVPSLDTPVCALSAQRFNKEVAALRGVVLVNISADLPFAQKRFCGAEGLANVVTLSTMRGQEFLKNYGVAISSGPLAGVAARATIVLDENNKVLHSQLVAEIKNEPDYDAALKALG